MYRRSWLSVAVGAITVSRGNQGVPSGLNSRGDDTPTPSEPSAETRDQPNLQPSGTRFPSGPCAQYNTAFQRLQWATRDERCSGTPGCEFLGHKLTGSCVKKADHVFHEENEESRVVPADWALAEEDSAAISAATSVIATLAADPLSGVQQLVNDKLALSASDTIKESHDDAERLAKKLVLEALNKVEYRNEFGKVLEYIFSVESVRRPTRDLIYWSVSLPLSLNEIDRQAFSYARFFFIPSTRSAMPAAGADSLRHASGFSYTTLQLSTLISWWLMTPHAKTVVNPLLEWTLKQPHVSEAVVQIVNDALPYCAPYWKMCAKDAIKASLQSHELKIAARDSLMFLLKNVGEAPFAETEQEHGNKKKKKVVSNKGLKQQNTSHKPTA